MIFRFVPIFAVSVRDSVGFLGTPRVLFTSTAGGLAVADVMIEIDSMGKSLKGEQVWSSYRGNGAGRSIVERSADEQPTSLYTALPFILSRTSHDSRSPLL
jgi:hypothetical protein